MACLFERNFIVPALAQFHVVIIDFGKRFRLWRSICYRSVVSSCIVFKRQDISTIVA